MAVFFGVLLVLGLILEISSLYSGLRKIRFTYKPAVTCTEPDEPFPLELRLVNHSLLPATFVQADITCPKDARFAPPANVIQHRNSNTLHNIFRVWGKQVVTRQVSVTIPTRGVHVFTEVDMLRGDFLGFGTVSGQVQIAHEVLVFPKLLDSTDLRDALGTFCGDSLARRHLIRDPIITMGLREYTGREPMKTISWTQTARRGELMVREFDYTRDLSCMVLLATDNMSHKDVAKLDLCCSIARTVVEELTSRDIHVQLHTNAPLWGYANRGIWSCAADSRSNQDVLETLARVYAAARCSVRELAGVCAQSADRATAFVVIAPENSPEINDALQLIHDETGMEPLLITADDV